LSEALAPKPQPYTKEWYDEEMRLMEEVEEQRILELQAERREAEDWGLGWDETSSELISYRSFTRRDYRRT